jgi:hypothetical protein
MTAATKGAASAHAMTGLVANVNGTAATAAISPARTISRRGARNESCRCARIARFVRWVRILVTRIPLPAYPTEQLEGRSLKVAGGDSGPLPIPDRKGGQIACLRRNADGERALGGEHCWTRRFRRCTAASWPLPPTTAKGGRWRSTERSSPLLTCTDEPPPSRPHWRSTLPRGAPTSPPCSRTDRAPPLPAYWLPCSAVTVMCL